MKGVNDPTIFVIFGITGDLSRGKLVPALFDLYLKNRMPAKFHIIGFSRRDFSESEFREYVAEVLEYRIGDVDKNTIADFAHHFSYTKGLFEDEAAYKDLAVRLKETDDLFRACSNKLFYLAVPPSYYESILNNLSHSGLTIPCGGDDGWTRVLVEKPFGSNVETARKLDMLLGKLFKETQVFRIDHYLAKETLQNILAFRFSNSIFEPLWNRDYIEKVEINLLEHDTIESRANFYDETGALKDVGQNHLLQMLALIAMEKPDMLFPDTIRQARADVLTNLKRMTRDEAERDTVRGQYEGYQEALHVPGSETETFFSVTARINSKRWKDVPFVLTSGKGLSEDRVEIKIHFKDTSPGSFMPKQYLTQEANQLIFSIKPEEKISILFWIKVPGFENKIEPKKLTFAYTEGGEMVVVPNAYERVLHDCIAGDQTLFASTAEIEGQWNFIESVLEAWQTLPIHVYKRGSDAGQIERIGKVATGQPYAQY
ncbi:MAG TPA: glucose-6-phosphate dehydrogenase [Candidatus Paceibacterota bacterium]|jgi:glucose-6-phosphate 1-dehydrogenase|nr:glucose-6-phosphate dehydrogenase [Candidatus Paceibacterota bacterium]